MTFALLHDKRGRSPRVVVDVHRGPRELQPTTTDDTMAVAAGNIRSGEQRRGQQREVIRTPVNHSEIISFLWGVADLIRDTFKRGKSAFRTFPRRARSAKYSSVRHADTFSTTATLINFFKSSTGPAPPALTPSGSDVRKGRSRRRGFAR